MMTLNALELIMENGKFSILNVDKKVLPPFQVKTNKRQLIIIGIKS